MKILMLGNSLTTANGLPALLARLTGADVTVHARGGARLAEHLHSGTVLGDRTAAALALCGWDFVILQEMSRAPASNPDAYLKSVSALCARIRAADACPVLFGTWAYREGSARLARTGMGYAEMCRRMEASFAEAARLTGAPLADVRTGFADAPDPGLLYAPDGVHPSAKGTALAAQILADTVAKFLAS